MGLQFLLFLALTIFKVQSFPVKVFKINQWQTKDYEVFKDILIQNLIVTTDNLKLILNWERDNTLYRIQDEEEVNTKLTNYNIVKNISPYQDATTSKSEISKKLHDEEQVKGENKAIYDMLGSHTAKDVPISLNDFQLSKYLRKRSPDGAEIPTEYEIKSEVEEEEEDKGNYDEAKALMKRESNEYSSIVLSEENLLNYGNSNSLELDNNSDSEYSSEKTKRQAEGENPLPIPTGDGDTQVFMGTFQAVMRPMKLPSLG